MDLVVGDSPEFHRLVEGARDVDLARVAIEIARDAYPALDPATVQSRLDALAERVKARLGAVAEPWLVLEAVAAVLFREEGLRGNEDAYYDPRNSYINQVLDRRLGIPISLGIICMAVARRAGLTLAGVNLPAHFVLRHDTEDGPVFIDPYHNGCLLDRNGLSRLVAQISGTQVQLSETQFAACGPDVIVRRLLYNLKLIHLRDRRMNEAIPVLKRLTLLSPETPGELRDLGIACFYGERREEAVSFLTEYLRRSPYADDADEIRILLQEP